MQRTSMFTVERLALIALAVLLAALMVVVAARGCARRPEPKPDPALVDSLKAAADKDPDTIAPRSKPRPRKPKPLKKNIAPAQRDYLRDTVPLIKQTPTI